MRRVGFQHDAPNVGQLAGLDQRQHIRMPVGMEVVELMHPRLVGAPVAAADRAGLSTANFLIVARVFVIQDELAVVLQDIERIDIAIRSLANLAIDCVAEKVAETADEVKRYAASDLVFYRADEPEGLVAQQAKHWDPVLRWARETLGANFVFAADVSHVAQPDSALTAVGKEIDRFAPPFALAALASVTQLTGSALIALMLAHGKLTPVAAWNAAHVDEGWNARTWGEDAEAAARRAQRLSEFEAAAKMLSFCRP